MANNNDKWSEDFSDLSRRRRNNLNQNKGVKIAVVSIWVLALLGVGTFGGIKYYQYLHRNDAKLSVQGTKSDDLLTKGYREKHLDDLRAYLKEYFSDEETEEIIEPVKLAKTKSKFDSAEGQARLHTQGMAKKAISDNELVQGREYKDIYSKYDGLQTYVVLRVSDTTIKEYKDEIVDLLNTCNKHHIRLFLAADQTQEFSAMLSMIGQSDNYDELESNGFDGMSLHGFFLKDNKVQGNVIYSLDEIPSLIKTINNTK